MKVIVVKDYDSLGKKTFALMKEILDNKPDAVIGLPTGSTPIAMYDEAAAACARGEVSFRDVVTFNLDEYVGLPPENPNSYHYFMNEHFHSRVDILPENAHVPDGMADDIEAECERYEKTLEEQGPMDIMFLGMGLNGHLGFNEPSARIPEKTQTVDLTRTTISANARFFHSIEEVPTKAVTMGIGSIFSAKRLVCMANGKAKADIVAQVVKGEITPMIPASLLRIHPDATLVLDEEAASML